MTRLILPAGLALGLVLFPLRVTGLTLRRLPGDLVDARFNLYVLEHGYRWLTGADRSFWEAPFFAPEPNVIAYSDSHLGTLPLFALFRFVGCGRETAFQCWWLALFVLNYLACAWALRRFGFGRMAAAAGAYVFAFGLPVVGQIGHAQLLPRFLVPVAFAFAWRFLRRPAAGPLLGLALCLVWQFYCTIYVGYFLALTLGLFAAAYLGVGRRTVAWRALAGRSAPDTLARLSAVAGCGLALLPLAGPHARVAAVNGTPGAGQVAAMQPRWQSLLLPPAGSLLWSGLRPLAASLPMAHEHALFVGALPAIALLGALVGRRRWGRGPVVRAAALAVVLAVLLTSVHLPLYGYILRLPLACSMRAVARIGLVLAFPVAVAVAALVAKAHRLQSVGLLVLLAAIALDQAARRTPGDSFDKVHAQRRVERLTVKLTREGPPPAVFAYVTRSIAYNWDWHYQQLDAMLAAQSLDVATVNGYSGNFPRGWRPPLGREDVAAWLRTAAGHAGARLIGEVAIVYEE